MPVYSRPAPPASRSRAEATSPTRRTARAAAVAAAPDAARQPALLSALVAAALLAVALLAGCAVGPADDLSADVVAPDPAAAADEAAPAAQAGDAEGDDAASGPSSDAPDAGDEAADASDASNGASPGGVAPASQALSGGDAPPAEGAQEPASADSNAAGASAPVDPAGAAPPPEGAAAAEPASEVASAAGEPAADVAAPPAAPAAVVPPGGFEDPRNHPLSIERLRTQSYPGSDLAIVETLQAGSNYSRYVASYQSEGLTIYGLLTIPSGERPATGWPVVIFNHGYIPPAQYRTTERYVAYQDAFARAGYITLKSDYRGHGSSQGEASGGRGSPDYTIDVLNGMASVARHPDADPGRIGMWGHSMGGSITLRAMVLSPQIKAGVIWAGVVASYPDMYNRLGQGPATESSSGTWNGRRGWRTELVERFGTPEQNPAAWNALSPNAYLADISGPLQLHHGTADHSVPVEYSAVLQQQMEAAGRPSEYFVYEGDDHNLAGSLSTALQRSVAFFDQHVKGGG